MAETAEKKSGICQPRFALREPLKCPVRLPVKSEPQIGYFKIVRSGRVISTLYA